MRIGQTSFVVFVSKLLSSVLGFAATLYFARFLGAEVLGYFSLALVVAKWLRLGGEVGVASAVTKRISEGEDQDAYFTAGLLVIGGLAALCSIGLFVFRGTVDGFVGAGVTELVILLVVVGLFGSLVGSALQGHQMVHVSGLLSPIRIGGRSLVQIGLVFAGFNLTGMLLGYAVGDIVVAAVGLSVLSIGIARPRREHFRKLFEFAKYSWLGSLRGRSFNDVDILVLGALVAPGLVGVYSVAWSLTSFIGVFGSSIRTTAFPELSKADSEGDEALFEAVVTDTLAFSGLVAIPGLFGGILLADRVMRLYGEAFGRGATVLGLLILAMLLYDYQNQLLNALNGLNRPDLSFRVNAGFILVNLGLNIVLVLAIGFEGAAVATVLAAGFGTVLAFVYLRRILSFAIPIGELLRQTAAALIMSVIVTAGRSVVEISPIASNNAAVVTTLVTVGAGTYFIVLLAISRRFQMAIAENAPVRIPFITDLK